MPVERETIVTNGDSGGGGSTGLLIVVAILVILALVGGFTVFNGGFSIGGGTVDVPKVTVTK